MTSSSRRRRCDNRRERWGELCGSPEPASPACLSYLLVAEWFDGLLTLIDTASRSYREFPRHLSDEVRFRIEQVSARRRSG
ncbi:hypothetical protein [Lamprobacter sp.]|uniref:hypothetical protein n=1 Tax=Lamprobacter sp. TaxID=3100796 RepID=UPI002B25BD66|nr:hypothetical protein [Lamprobacter sp.]